MTAEIAILNKSAVTLAADSAVTVQSGDQEEKTYDSADKLFELCKGNAIGVMIYNGLSFMEVPLQTLIKQYRTSTGVFSKVEDAAYDFLNYLNQFGATSPAAVKERAIRRIVNPILSMIQQRFQSRAQQKFVDLTKKDGPQPDFAAVLESTLDEVIGTFDRAWQSIAEAEFIGGAPPDFTQFDSILESSIASEMPIATVAQKNQLKLLLQLVLRKGRLSNSLTGIVVAGFGKTEIFPTLISFEIDGIVGDRLKFRQTNYVDIDREGDRAKVIPFAQKEMVDRFLYGLDENIERQIIGFCKRTVPDVRKAMISQIVYEDENDKKSFEESLQLAEDAFVGGLQTDAFHQIRSEAQSSIEGLIEFMPKPEMAKMAEALVNLTSIKKRVSRGMDTVGGPIDVAVISLAEGFVWVKRKHYFPADLNHRFFNRVLLHGDPERATHDQPSRGSSRDRNKGSKKRRRPPTRTGGSNSSYETSD